MFGNIFKWHKAWSRNHRWVISFELNGFLLSQYESIIIEGFREICANSLIFKKGFKVSEKKGEKIKDNNNSSKKQAKQKVHSPIVN